MRTNRYQKPSARIKYDLSPLALERWNPSIRAADDSGNDIGIYEHIGEDMWGDGVSAKRIAAALRAIGNRDVVVNINSPGGDMFEGLAIYNLLREHQGRVTVRVLSLAASAASIIAMAGDEIQIARAGFLMIHNAWVCYCGNRNDFREIADYLEPFDRSMADVYQARTGGDLDEIRAMMDAETWIGGSDAIEKGFADSLLASDEVIDSGGNSNARAASRLDIALAKAGLPRSERRRLLKEFKSSTLNAAGDGMHNAAATGMPSATEIEAEPLPRLSLNI
ncbi:ATP-dependent Clp protease proteolytic subunit [Microbulbifer thermotolerans]|uniref:head maturation protease, ClpP-related n=1 Tax=Microbulbifer thermotolerans TaxID=252514 RepID=UPI002671BA81|nr:head maturation protease, ClpP-related [Microbulbifer thermotolerans]WKT59115.1 ATP-dependent Clp protease proteolytic subunit [Microbulbifer thermotolerans]